MTTETTATRLTKDDYYDDDGEDWCRYVATCNEILHKNAHYEHAN